MCEQCKTQQDESRWLALLIRQGLKVIVVGIERRYGLREESLANVKNSANKSAHLTVVALDTKRQ